MKNIFKLLFVLQFSFCFSQNNQPQITITSIENDNITETLTINYSLEDIDGDNCEVWIKSSLDGGEFFETIPSSEVIGDVGLIVSPSEQRTLVWDYANLSSSINAVNIRLLATDNKDVDIAEMVSQVDQNKLLTTLQNIVGPRHYSTAPENLTAVRNYVSNAFNSANLQTEAQNFQFASTTMQNIIGRKPGAKDESITFIIDGHFDGVSGSPAADDNGSAVSGMLEALRILSQYSFEHSIRFIGFDAEELGLIGSSNYVQTGIKSYEDIQGVLNLEMIGYFSDQPNSQNLPTGFNILFPALYQEIVNDEFKGNFIVNIGNTTSNPLINAFSSAAATYVPQLKVLNAEVPGNGEIVPDLRRSDHASFWDGGFQAVLLTDTAEFRNDNYHTANDEISTLDLSFMQQVVQTTLATVAKLAVPISLGFDDADLSTLSIIEHEHSTSPEFFIYPNPSNGLLSLRVKDVLSAFKTRIEVYDVTGKRLHHEVLNINSGTSNTEINLKNLTPSSYILIVHLENTTKSLSFIISE